MSSASPISRRALPLGKPRRIVLVVSLLSDRAPGVVSARRESWTKLLSSCTLFSKIVQNVRTFKLLLDSYGVGVVVGVGDGGVHSPLGGAPLVVTWFGVDVIT